MLKDLGGSEIQARMPCLCILMSGTSAAKASTARGGWKGRVLKSPGGLFTFLSVLGLGGLGGWAQLGLSSRRLRSNAAPGSWVSSQQSDFKGVKFRTLRLTAPSTTECSSKNLVSHLKWDVSQHYVPCFIVGIIYNFLKVCLESLSHGFVSRKKATVTSKP